MALADPTAFGRRYAPILELVTLCCVRFGALPWDDGSARNRDWIQADRVLRPDASFFGGPQLAIGELRSSTLEAQV